MILVYLLYNSGKTDGLVHTFGPFLRKAWGFESHRFAWGKLYWVVNHDKNLVELRPFSSKLFGQKGFSKVCTGTDKVHKFFSASWSSRRETCVVTEVIAALCS